MALTILVTHNKKMRFDELVDRMVRMQVLMRENGCDVSLNCDKIADTLKHSQWIRVLYDDPCGGMTVMYESML